MDGDSHVSGLHHSESDRDRLSELPKFIILLILSFLPSRDAVKTTLLSKRWKDLWNTSTTLDFRHPSIENLDKFRNFVNRYLSLWKGSKIKKFTIDFKFDSSFTSDVDSWLRFAIENQVEELYISVMEYRSIDFIIFMQPDNEYYPPECLYSCSSITKLSLTSCKVQIHESVQWSRLKSLTIIGTDFEVIISEDAMNQIIAGAPQLEFLSLRSLDCRVRWNIRSTSLKTIKIQKRHSIRVSYIEASKVSILKIWAPNLESLEFVGVSDCSFMLEAPRLTNVFLGFHGRVKPDDADCGDFFLDEMVRQLFLSICHVEKIKLSHWCIMVLVEMKKDMQVPLLNAKFLEFTASSAKEMLFVLDMFPELTMLSVSLGNSLFPSVEVPETNPLEDSLQHLRTVEISWYVTTVAAYPAIQILLEKAHKLEKIVFRPSVVGSDYDRKLLPQAVEMVLSLPRSSPTATVTVIEESLL